MASQPPEIDAAVAAALLAKYRPLLHRAALRYTWLDLAQLRAAWEDSVLHAYRTYRPGAAGLAAWTRRLFRQRVGDLVRQSRNEPSTFGESLGEDPQIINGVNPERAFWAKTAMDELLKMDPRSQSIVVAHLHGYTYSEIGELCGIAPSTVQYQATRAINILKEKVGLGRDTDDECEGT